MYKQRMKCILYCFSLLILLNNCAPTSSAFLGPTLTVARTGSIPHAALSYTSNKMVKDIGENIKMIKEKKNKALEILEDLPGKSIVKINKTIKIPLENQANNFFKTIKEDLKNNQVISFN